MPRNTHAQLMAMRKDAEDARARWEKAIAEGRDHVSINAAWESYLGFAHRAGKGVYEDIEKAAALRARS